MHSTKLLASSDFEFTINERLSSLDELFPGFNKHDRFGFVVREYAGSIGFSSLLLAIVTRFYDFYRSEIGEDRESLRIYPEIFVFHIEKPRMNHYWLDVWPPHKEVIVADDPEQILEAINDRGITRLIVEELPIKQKLIVAHKRDINDTTTQSAVFLKETLASAEQRIVSVIAYSPTGRVEEPDVTVSSCANAEKLLAKSLNSFPVLSEDMQQSLLIDRQMLNESGRIVEGFKRMSVGDAICSLTDSVQVSEETLQYISLLES